ncbi:hypothetical protein AAVH_15836 [Aphelenchoides avenae]|nr:hypothetical protein AAVH_15836 [Aphelenchus avenae]
MKSKRAAKTNTTRADVVLDASRRGSASSRASRRSITSSTSVPSRRVKDLAWESSRTTPASGTSSEVENVTSTRRRSKQLYQIAVIAVFCWEPFLTE